MLASSSHLLFLAIFCSTCSSYRASSNTPLNVLFLVSDDMRPQLGCYEGEDFPAPVYAKPYTPNLDILASRSLLLRRAYVQQSLCNPSRSSVLTGRRPDTTRVYNNNAHFRTSGGNFSTIPQYFKDNGYLTYGMGKIFHTGHEDPVSWSEPYYHSPWYEYWYTHNFSWYAVPDSVIAKTPLPDIQIVDHAIGILQNISMNATHGKPFFLAVGLHKPHLPFVFPERFLSYYPEESVHLPDNPYAPVKMPSAAWYDYKGLRDFMDIKKLNASGAINSSLPDSVVLQLRRAYYSAVTYADFQIGRVLDQLQALGLAESTVISFFGDHGWQLGEHGEWCKFTNFELATHAPMMIHVPGLTDKGNVSRELVELVDLFPSLSEAAGLKVPSVCPEDSNKVFACTEGKSVLSLLKGKPGVWKKAAFSQFPFPKDGFDHPTLMGYSMRTDRYRYTEWVTFNNTSFGPVWDQLNSTELYDHDLDPQENWNHASEDAYSDVKKELSNQLHLGWRAAIKA